jgi:hypothetical protein
LKPIRAASGLSGRPATAMPRLPRLAPAAPLAALLGLAACDQGPATVTPYRHPTGAFDFLVAATRNGGPLYLEIDGDPFGTGEDLESLVIAALQPALQSRVLSLTTDQDAAEDPAFRLVLVFNPPDSGELMAFCASQPEGGSPEAEGAAAAGRVELRAGFCNGDDLLAAVDGWVEEAQGPGDARFEQLMHQVARDLFARRQADD